MGAEFLVVFMRSALLAACFGLIVASCLAGALRRGEGAAGAAVRITATILVPATLLALLGIFVWPIALGASLIGALWQGRDGLSLLVDRVRVTWSSASAASKVGVLTLLVAVAFRAGAALSTPPTDGDSLLYHLPMTAALSQDHGMWFTRALLYPGAAELGEAIGAATTGNVNGIVAFELVQVFALVLVGYGWARRAGASRDGALACAVVAGALPIVIDQTFTSQNDIFVCVMLASGCVLWRAAPRLAAIALGLVFAAKVTAFILVPAVMLVMLAFEGWPFSIADLFWGWALAAPWYVRTLALSGRPVDSVAVMGWNSTIAAHFATAWPLVLAALRTFGGLAALGGTVALACTVARRDRTRFARALPWLALVMFGAWIVMPNAAESVPGTLDQIRQGWSIRYVLLLPFILATALPIVIDSVTRLPVAGLIALAAAASAVVRSANATASQTALGFVYCVPLLLAALLIIMSLAARRPPARIAWLLCSLVIWSLTATTGASSMALLWNPTYIQWSRLIPASNAMLEAHVRASSKVAVIGMRSFPLVGANFSRRTYEQVLIMPQQRWLDELRRDGVHVMLAAGLSGSRDQPGFMQPLPAEAAIKKLPGVCLLATRGYTRVYGLDESTCRRAP
jgi:hypothetical protein